LSTFVTAGIFPENEALTLLYEMLELGTEDGYFMVFSVNVVFARYFKSSN